MATRNAILSLWLMSLLGCGTFSETSPLTTQLEPISFSLDLDAQIVVAGLEQAFLKTFGTPPFETMEASSDGARDDLRVEFDEVERRPLRLEGLSGVEKVMPRCPGHVVQLSHTQAIDPDQGWVDVFIACLQVTHHEQHIRFGMGAVGTKATFSLATNRQRRIRLKVLEELRDAFLNLYTIFPLNPTSVNASIKDQPALTPHLAAAATPVIVTPFLCLAPKTGIDTVLIYSVPQEGPVIGTLQAGHTVMGEEMVGHSFYLVRTEEGASGWVKHGATRRSPCPIG